MNLNNILVSLGGLGIFLLGIKFMSDGLEVIAGSKLKILIEKLTKNKYMGALVGAIVTAVIHSSAATTVMVVGFVNAGVMELSQAASVIMGANIGTTATGLMVAMDLSVIAPAIICVGASMFCFLKKTFYKNIGQILAGFGMLFFGLEIMGKAMEPLKDSNKFLSLMAYFKNPLLGLLAGIIITALLHSSTIIVGVLQSLGKAGAINLDSVVYIIYGQNIGTCVTALMASLGTNKTAKRSAIIHLLFNVIGTLMFVLVTLIFPFVDLVKKIVPGNLMAQIPIIHLVFNFLTTLILLPLNKHLINISYKIIRGEDEKKSKQSLLYLDNRILETPPIAVSQLIKEVYRMADLSRESFQNSIKSLLKKDSEFVNRVYEQEKTIDYLNTKITEYLVKINGLDINDSDKKLIGSLFHVISDIERIGDYCENICEVSESVISESVILSKDAKEEIKILSMMVAKIINKSVLFFKENELNEDIFVEISELEDEIDNKTEEYRENHIKRLGSGKCSAIGGAIFMDILTSLERIADHAINITFSIKKRL